jgi:hypothetical protein
MSRCPVCQSFQIVLVLNRSPKGWCSRCGAGWIQEGSSQRRVMRGLFGPSRERPTVRLPRVPTHSEPALEGLGA